MSERINTLLISANGTHPIAVLSETLTRGVLGLTAEAPGWVNRQPLLRQLVGRRYAAASYLDDWHEAFARHPALSTKTCNITNLIEYESLRRIMGDFDLIVVLHSAAGDRMTLLSRTATWFQRRRGKLAVFFGNEYDLLEEKIAFVNTARADYVCTQLPAEAARRLYQGCGGELLAMPHALNELKYRWRPDIERSIDIGFAGDLYDRLIGDRERTNLVEYFTNGRAPTQLRCDIRLTRMTREDWIAFLNRCHAVVGAESGTYYLSDGGRALACAKRYLRGRPDACFDEVFETCFKNVDRSLPAKAISSRHFEPIGMRTCQLLVEGHFNGILDADIHYIAVKKDLSNIEESIRRVQDRDHRECIAERAYQHVIAHHTYSHRVDRLIAAAFA